MFIASNLYAAAPQDTLRYREHIRRLFTSTLREAAYREYHDIFDLRFPFRHLNLRDEC